MVVEIVLSQKVDLKNFTLIEGFPGIGLVGTIAASYLVEKRGMVPIGHVYSEKFAPISVIHEGRPSFPVRIYKDPQKPFCVMLAEFVIPMDAVYGLANEIMRFVKTQGIRQIFSLAGMSSAEEEQAKTNVYGIASNDEMAGLLKAKKIPLINEGVTTGVSGILISKCALEGFPAVSLLAESSNKYPDPRASAALIEKLEGLTGLKVDTKALLAEAVKVEVKMQKLFSQMKTAKTTYQKAEETYPPMYM